MSKGYVIKLQDIFRWILHFPIGVAIAFLIMRVDAGVGIMVAIYFLLYEIMEDWRVSDRSFIDVFGSLIAMIGTAFVLYIWF